MGGANFVLEQIWSGWSKFGVGWSGCGQNSVESS